MTERPSDEAVERMVALITRIAGDETSAAFDRISAQTVFALLPKPIDPAMLACREICASSWDDGGTTQSHAADRYRRGDNDQLSSMRIALAAYRAGQASGGKP